MRSQEMLLARQALIYSRPQFASSNIPSLRSRIACFNLLLAILNYFRSHIFHLLHYYSLSLAIILLLFNLFFYHTWISSTAQTCLECPRGRMAVWKERNTAILYKLYLEVMISRAYKQDMIFWFCLLHITYFALSLISGNIVMPTYLNF